MFHWEKLGAKIPTPQAAWGRCQAGDGGCGGESWEGRDGNILPMVGGESCLWGGWFGEPSSQHSSNTRRAHPDIRTLLAQGWMGWFPLQGIGCSAKCLRTVRAPGRDYGLVGTALRTIGTPRNLSLLRGM